MIFGTTVTSWRPDSTQWFVNVQKQKILHQTLSEFSYICSGQRIIHFMRDVAKARREECENDKCYEKDLSSMPFCRRRGHVP